MIDKLLKQVKDTVCGKESEITEVMYEAIETTLRPAESDNSRRQARFLKLVIKCASEDEHREEIRQFTTGLIAADFYFSVGKGLRGVPFLNKAFRLLAQLTDTEPLSIADADGFVGQFRARNLKGKFLREFQAVKNIYVLGGAARRLNPDLPLDELPADFVPASRFFRDISLFILLGVAGSLLVIYALDDYHTARFAGTPIPLSEALHTGDILLIITGIILIVMELAGILWQNKPSYNRLMFQIYYWRFSHRKVRFINL